MKKIKISELPLYQSLIGLFTIGTDANNRSVKVSLEFIERSTTEAVSNADQATAAANEAATLAKTATNAANTATTNANKATENANTATSAANAAAKSANEKAALADTSAGTADKAAAAAKEAQQAAEKATALSETATAAADQATAAANEAATELLDLIDRLIPTGIDVSYTARLTYGNVQPVYISVGMIPSTAMKNIIFISDNKAVEVGTDGRLTITGKGSSRIMVIPTLNTALARTLLIEVSEPTLRLVNNRKTLRFTSSGALRLN